MMRSILLADQSKIFRQTLGSLLGSKFTILSTDNGYDAVSLYVSHTPVCVLTELIFSKGNGIEIIERILAKDSDANIIVITSVQNAIMWKKVLDLGVKLVITKPISINNIQQAFTTLNLE